jgi:2',3'-cyclic-nucleotide 2'-phosphodiesterase (5'-nucleotidase family)
MDAIRRLYEDIEKLVEIDELAAVFVHLNDTYIIEERQSAAGLDRPGMARIASLVKGIKERANRNSAADRVLVLHSGDFLLPSYLSNRCDTFGEPMLAALECCQLDFLTLGNHEFDHDEAGSTERLRAVLAKARRARVLGANIEGCDDLPLDKCVLWPSDEPFVALFALAGADTIQKASEHGLATRPWGHAAAEAFDEISRDERIGYVVILSHMDRDEDRALQSFVHQRWHPNGFCHIFGGHDHHVRWREPGAHCSFSKNLANARTVTVSLLTRTTAAAPPSRIPLPAADAAAPDPVEQVKAHYLRTIGYARPAYLQDAYLRHVDRVASDRRLRSLISPDSATYDLAYWARGYAFSDFQSGWTDVLTPNGVETSLFRQLAGSDMAVPLPDDETASLVSEWSGLAERRLAEALANVGAQPDDIVVDFSHRDGVEMDARDKTLREGSTDFGNFVADCVRQAVGCDLALIHAGSFRSDEAFGPVLKVRDLAETFIYDGADTLVVIDLSGEEVDAILAHSVARGESGAFLQASAGVGEHGGRDRIRTAIASYLLKSNQDGYQAILAARRGVDGSEIRALAEDNLHGVSLIDLIVSAASRVEHCAEPRLRAATSRKPIESWTSSFLPLVERYVTLCRAARIETGHQLSILQFAVDCLFRNEIRLTRVSADGPDSEPERMIVRSTSSKPDRDVAHWTREGYEVEEALTEEIELGEIMAVRSLIYEQVGRLFEEKLADTDVVHDQFMLVHAHLRGLEEGHRDRIDYAKFLECAFDLELIRRRRRQVRSR